MSEQYLVSGFMRFLRRHRYLGEDEDIVFAVSTDEAADIASAALQVLNGADIDAIRNDREGGTTWAWPWGSDWTPSFSYAPNFTGPYVTFRFTEADINAILAKLSEVKE